MIARSSWVVLFLVFLFFCCHGKEERCHVALIEDNTNVLMPKTIDKIKCEEFYDDVKAGRVELTGSEFEVFLSKNETFFKPFSNKKFNSAIKFSEDDLLLSNTYNHNFPDYEFDKKNLLIYKKDSDELFISLILDYKKKILFWVIEY
ncbi:hypothetical protein JIP1097_110001 [Tenacibaculum maritimum]|uniref:hypothetical protein n=1 Tax=Tenacibaculum maritimum TaxID=107401 RepID=UPI0012E6EA30|nr:hypothetical protein [Tenacibaculum maritimum]CAA0159459.1 hypothetical protein JIP1097_110001 [Tenacibaculum maritimum]